ncbi:hypothetical protein NX059_008418 [Plenodomus lindquistii]|nr:hypothetical protein NX059_008418 [Plenodomus lindquistii]
MAKIKSEPESPSSSLPPSISSRPLDERTRIVHDHELFWRGYFAEKHEKDVRELGCRIKALEEALERGRERGVQGGEARGKLELLRGKWKDMAGIFGRGAEGAVKDGDAGGREMEREGGEGVGVGGVGTGVVDLGEEEDEQH